MPPAVVAPGIFYRDFFGIVGANNQTTFMRTRLRINLLKLKLPSVQINYYLWTINPSIKYIHIEYMYIKTHFSLTFFFDLTEALVLFSSINSTNKNSSNHFTRFSSFQLHSLEVQGSRITGSRAILFVLVDVITIRPVQAAVCQLY